MSNHLFIVGVAFVVAVGQAAIGDDTLTAQISAQQNGTATSTDTPKSIDPAVYIPQPLLKHATIEFHKTPLTDVVAWLEQELKIPVVLDKDKVEESGLSLETPVTDRLTDDPIYLLLNRLHAHRLEWNVQDNVLFITTIEEANAHRIVRLYDVGDLVANELDVRDIIDLLQTVVPASWADHEGENTDIISHVGIVISIRQPLPVQRRIEAILAALRKHGRKTYAYEPSKHAKMREILDTTCDVDFRGAPLTDAVGFFAQTKGIDIRIDTERIEEAGVGRDVPVTLKVADLKLRAVLNLLLEQLDLAWTLRDGVLWITTFDEARNDLKTMVFDVRDLATEQERCDALDELFETQTSGDWNGRGGSGGVEGGLVIFVPGTLVVTHNQENVDEITVFLERLREIARDPKAPPEVVSPDEVITSFYRMDHAIAERLNVVLPELVAAETWKTEQRPDAVGRITQIPSQPKFVNEAGREVAVSSDAADADKRLLAMPQSVLVIVQTRAIHTQIAKIIERIEHGDPRSGFLGWEPQFTTFPP